MKALKPAVTLAGAIAAIALGGTALANQDSRDSWPPPVSVTPRHIVVPQQPAVVGYVTAPTAYYYEPAPRYYYYQPAPTYYYQEPSYYYYDNSSFPRSNSED